MATTKRKVAAAALACAAALGLSAAVAARTTPVPGQAPKEEERKLAEARREAAKDAYEQLFEPLRRGVGAWPAPETVYHWSCRWLESEVDCSPTQTERLAAYRRHLDRMKEVEKQIREAEERTGVRSQRALAVKYYRVEAELWLTRFSSK